MKMKTLFFVFFLLLFSFSVSSIPPHLDFGDLVVVYPQNSFFPYGVDNTLNFQAFDSANVMLLNTQFDCLIHVYDNIGSVVYEGVVGDGDDDYDKELVMNNSILRKSGFHSYNVWCNSTTDSGGVSEDFMVNVGGLDSENSNNSFNGIFLLIGFGLIAFISLLCGNAIKDKKLEGIKLFLWGFSLLHILFISGVLMLQSLTDADIGNVLRYNGVLISYFVIITLSVLYIIYTYFAYIFVDNVADGFSGGRG